MSSNKEITVQIIPKTGLHLRTSSYVVREYDYWIESFDSEKIPHVLFDHKGWVGSPGKLLFVAGMGLYGGDKLQIIYEGCTYEEIKVFINAVGNLGLWREVK